MKLKSILSSISTFAIAATLTLTSSVSADTNPDLTIPDNIAADTENFTILSSLLESSFVGRVIDARFFNFTFFAPTDAAFEALDPEILEVLRTNNSQARFVLFNHILRGSVSSDRFENGQLETLIRRSVDLEVAADGSVAYGGGSVTGVDMFSSNGVIHVIDKVILPADFITLIDPIRSNEELDTFEAAIETAGYSSIFGRRPRISRPLTFTIFAPSDSAFDAAGTILSTTTLARRTLHPHILFGVFDADELTDGRVLTAVDGTQLTVSNTGGVISVNGVTISTQDIEASNGVIHILDGVLSAQ